MKIQYIPGCSKLTFCQIHYINFNSSNTYNLPITITFTSISSILTYYKNNYIPFKSFYTYFLSKTQLHSQDITYLQSNTITLVSSNTYILKTKYSCQFVQYIQPITVSFKYVQYLHPTKYNTFNTCCSILTPLFTSIPLHLINSFTISNFPLWHAIYSGVYQFKTFIQISEFILTYYEV